MAPSNSLFVQRPCTMFAVALFAQLADLFRNWWMLAVAADLVVVIFLFIIAMLAYGKLWFQAYMSNARVSMVSLIGMGFRQVNARTIVQAKVMAMQSGIDSDPRNGITTRRLEANYLAGGNVMNVITAIIA